MKPSVQIPVEVSANVTSRGEYRFQTVYVNIGGKYPVELDVFVRDANGPLPAGNYVANKLEHQVVGKRQSFVLDLQNLEAVK